mmetsp:Transcript_12915/g.21114  ORF Transcript_12915/g.21114 Transcript_12915/m.21114 type:complete len:243 (-) Transcript_12915:1355-2083(-)
MVSPCPFSFLLLLLLLLLLFITLVVLLLLDWGPPHHPWPRISPRPSHRPVLGEYINYGVASVALQEEVPAKRIEHIQHRHTTLTGCHVEGKVAIVVAYVHVGTRPEKSSHAIRRTESRGLHQDRVPHLVLHINKLQYRVAGIDNRVHEVLNNLTRPLLCPLMFNCMRCCGGVAAVVGRTRRGRTTPTTSSSSKTKRHARTRKQVQNLCQLILRNANLTKQIVLLTTSPYSRGHALLLFYRAD